ncbi:MAG TPA: glycosyltransferase [Clostridia bacterium]|nr:glycosyltransferase [Clostridia bacterium]
MPTTDKNPAVSIVMGVRYQRSDTSLLERSVRSILAQSFTNFEFLICQNDSTSEAVALLNQLAAEDKRIRLIDGTGTDSLTKKLNRCIFQARGIWLARMDDDDVSYPDRFDHQIAFLQEHTNIAAVGCCVREIDDEMAHVRMLPPFPQLRDFRVTFPFVHPTLVLRRDAVEAVGGYSENTLQEGCDDYDLLLRMYGMGYRAANVQKVLLDYSVVSSQLSHRPYRLFYNEFRTRMAQFGALGLLPRWLIWAGKPLATGLLPRRLLYRIKRLLGR